jgi:hypothetical protein
MLKHPGQFAGGTLPDAGSNGRVLADRLNSFLGALKIAMGCCQTNDPGVPELLGRRKSADSGPSTTTKCALLPARVVQFEGRGLADDSLLTPELRQFIDRVIVPILIERYLVERHAKDRLVESGGDVEKLHRKPAPQRNWRS